MAKNPILPDDIDLMSIAVSLQQIAGASKEDAERLATQEANYSHLAKAIEGLTTSNATAFAELTATTSDLALTIERIALNEQHIEERILKELDTLRDDYLQTRSDAFASREKLELCIRDHNIRISALEIINAKGDGAEEQREQRRTFWNANGKTVLFIIIVAIPVIGSLYALITGANP